MTPWQIDCKMPSIRMGALIGTSVCAASDSGDIMGVDCGEVRLLRRLINAPSPVSVGTVSCGRPARDETRRGPSDLVTVPFPQSRSQKDMSQSCLTRPRRKTSLAIQPHRIPFVQQLCHGMRTARRMLLCGPFNKMNLVKIKIAASCGPYPC
jgi:hypothetical protein